MERERARQVGFSSRVDNGNPREQIRREEESAYLQNARHVTGQWCRPDTRAFGVVVHTDIGDQWSRPHVHSASIHWGVTNENGLPKV